MLQNKKNKLLSFEFDQDALIILDQCALPKVEYRRLKQLADFKHAINSMQVRGAPAIGCVAAYGAAIEAMHLAKQAKEVFLDNIAIAMQELEHTRPTAVNLSWAIDRLRNLLVTHSEDSPQQLANRLLDEAKKIEQEDIKTNQSIGELGAALFKSPVNLLTYCNTGSFATAGYGTALGVIRSLKNKGLLKTVYACETRPYLQGARLTSVELLDEQLEGVLITDNAAGLILQQGMVDAIVVGADRIAANGDTANKIGTYSLAILAQYHKIPFYVAAPRSTIDLNTESGENIVIEERPAKELKGYKGEQWAPESIASYNPGFDVTPVGLISGIITEQSVLLEPNKQMLTALFDGPNN